MPNKKDSNRSIIIAGKVIFPGEEVQIDANISKLPTRTSIDIPIIVSRSKVDGPVLLLMGGLHGDEINGVEIVRRIIANGDHRPLIGTIICIPVLNVYGFINHSREVPDGKDINRSFPGSRTGSLASQIAFHLRTTILPQIDVGIDFHTGGSRINNFPQIRTVCTNEKNLKLAKIFSTKFILNSSLIEKSLRKEAWKQNKPYLLFEGGESMRLRKNVLDEGVGGALRVMKFLGMKKDAPKPNYQPITLQKSTWIRSNAAGMFHSYVRSGSQLKIGDVIGLITGPLGEFERQVISKTDGYIISVNNMPIVNRGDALLHVGTV